MTTSNDCCLLLPTYYSSDIQYDVLCESIIIQWLTINWNDGHLFVMCVIILPVTKKILAGVKTYLFHYSTQLFIHC